MIDVLVPVLDRPENAAPLVESFRAHSDGMDEITFLCSPGDDAEIEACLQTRERVLVVPFQAGPGDYARKMNYGFSMSERPFLFLGSDDISFSNGWSEAALEQNADVVATNDQANAQVKRGEFGTHCLVRRTYIEEQGGSCDGPGVLLHEGYDHNFVDRELCHLAQSRGVYKFARNSIVSHRHPLWRTARWDSTYRKGMENFHADRALFLERSQMWGFVGLQQSERMVARRFRREKAKRR